MGTTEPVSERRDLIIFPRTKLESSIGSSIWERSLLLGRGLYQVEDLSTSSRALLVVEDLEAFWMCSSSYWYQQHVLLLLTLGTSLRGPLRAYSEVKSLLTSEGVERTYYEYSRKQCYSQAQLQYYGVE